MQGKRDMNNEEKNQIKKVLIIFTAAVILLCLILTVFFRTAAVTGIFRRIISILEPFLWGFAIAYLLRPVSSYTERLLTGLEEKVSKKHRPGLVRMGGIVAALLLLFAVVVLFILAVLPQMINSISGLLSQLPDSVRSFQIWLETFAQGNTTNELVLAMQETVDTLGERLQEYLRTDLLPNLSTVVSRVTSSFMGILLVLKNFGLGCIIAAYILASWEKFTAQAKMIVYGLFPQRAADWIRDEVRFADRMFSGFIRGKILDSLIIGLICLIFTLITRMPYAVLISVIVGVTNIIPFFGPYIGAIPSALLILTVSPAKCLVFVIFIIVLQQVDGNYIGPAILGDRLGISGIWILFSIMVFSALWGILGMLIGVPVFAVIYDLIRKLIYRCLKKRGQEEMIRDYDKSFH